jgi:hypothetical protein
MKRAIMTEGNSSTSFKLKSRFLKKECVKLSNFKGHHDTWN